MGILGWVHIIYISNSWPYKAGEKWLLTQYLGNESETGFVLIGPQMYEFLQELDSNSSRSLAHIACLRQVWQRPKYLCLSQVWQRPEYLCLSQVWQRPEYLCLSQVWQRPEYLCLSQVWQRPEYLCLSQVWQRPEYLCLRQVWERPKYLCTQWNDL